jgi:DNA helicase IV
LSHSENLEIIAKVYEAYESLKRQERTLDFEDILLLTVGMLEEDRGVRERVRDQYRYFTVDEYQDVSPLQQRLLNLWLGNREEICVVGDAAQTIYSFAGATSNFLLSFKNRFPDAQVFRLSRGYRSTPEIINTANQDKKNETLFINLSLKEIFINLISACIDILNEFLDLKEFTLTNYIKILSKDDRLIYVGIILIIISILLFI